MISASNTQSRPTKYPWKSWLNPKRKGVRKLYKGKDFDVQRNGLAVTIRQRAEKMGLWVSLSLQEDNCIVINSVTER